MNRGSNYEDLYRGGLDSDSDDSNSDAGRCMFGKANAGFDTDDDWSSLDSDLYEPEDKGGDFEYRPLNNKQKSNGTEYNRAALDVDDDLSVGSDNEFIRASKSNKKWDWVEADEQSVGSDDDFEVQFAGRSNGIYDLKGGQGEIEDFLGGGGGEDDNEDMAFHTDYAVQQRTEAFLNEGQQGTRSGGRATQRGGEVVETEYLPAKAGAAQRRRVNPAFIAAHNQGTAKSRELVEQGLARARARTGRGRSLAEQQVGSVSASPAKAVTEKASKIDVDETVRLKADLKAEAESRAETQVQAKARIDRSLAAIRSAMAGAKTEAAREAVEERILTEIDGITTDLKSDLEGVFQTNPEGDFAKQLTFIQAQIDKVESKVKEGLSAAGMITAAKNMLILEAKYKQLVKDTKVADEPPTVPYQQQDIGRPVIELAGITVKPVGVKKSDVYGVDGGKIDKYTALDVLEKNKAIIKALPTKTAHRSKVMAQIQRFIDNHNPLGKPLKARK